MKFTTSLALVSALCWTVQPAHAFPWRREDSNTTASASPSGSASASPSQTQSQAPPMPSSSLPSFDASKFDGVWYPIAIEEDVYEMMTEEAKKFNATCDCPEVAFSSNTPVTLSANVSCTLHTKDIPPTRYYSTGLLVPVIDKVCSKSNNGTAFAFLFSQPYISTNEKSWTAIENVLNIREDDAKRPPEDTGSKGMYCWSFYSSQNGTDDVALLRTRGTVSADGETNLPDFKVMLAKSRDVADNSTYDQIAPKVLGNDYQDDYAKLPKCDSSGSPVPSPSSAAPTQSPSSTESASASSTESASASPAESSSEAATSTASEQPQPTEQPQPSGSVTTQQAMSTASQ
ncbi:hypothetical protein DM01DRAFT_1383678 [Hesseltinella vesiculosa]|uniref:Calycin-like protein n=1 Tax=Hesseltinella vesiculosa TaxID=101127 RepID=A0A1X2GH89_9FUNG|nr:hypothetical protein DM01DRAFT_1383678 [Hesseltinella vesiculosa]